GLGKIVIKRNALLAGKRVPLAHDADVAVLEQAYMTHLRVGVQRRIDGKIQPAGRQFLGRLPAADRKSTRLNSSHVKSSYAVFCYGGLRLPLAFPTRRSSDLGLGKIVIKRNALLAGKRVPLAHDADVAVLEQAYMTHLRVGVQRRIDGKIQPAGRQFLGRLPA